MVEFNTQPSCIYRKQEVWGSYLKVKFLENAREKSGQFINLYRVDELYCLSDAVERK